MMPTSIRSFAAVGAIACAAFISACASTGGGAGGGVRQSSTIQRRAACLLRSDDSVYLQGGDVYRDCAVDKQASVVTTNVHPDFRVTGPAGACYTAEWEFVVGENGEPEAESQRLLHASDDQFAEAVHAMIGQLRYQPAVRDGNPVRQIVIRRESAQVRTDFTNTVAGLPPSTSTPSSSGSPSTGQPGSSTGSSKTTAGAPLVGPGTAPTLPVIWGTC